MEIYNNKIETIFNDNNELQQIIIKTAIDKALADIYGLLLQEESEYKEYQKLAKRMFEDLAEFQSKFPVEFEFCYPPKFNESVADDDGE